MARRRVEIDGLDELIAKIVQLKEFPKDQIESAAYKGALIVINAVESAAPIGKTGELKSGFVILKGHPRRTSVGYFDVRENPSMNSIFRKPIHDKGKFGGTRDDSYYPSAVEFGHKTGDRYTKKGTKRKGKAGNFVAGKHYMKNAGYRVASTVLNTVASDLSVKIEALLRRSSNLRAEESSINNYVRDMELSNGRRRGSYTIASRGYLNLRTGR